MTAHRAAAQAEADVTRAHHDCLLAGTVPRQARRRGQSAQPAACRALLPQPESVKLARDFTRVTLRSWGLSALSDDAELVVSELVTNALRHAVRGPDSDKPAITLRLLAQAPYLMCMVSDPSREIPLRRESGPEDPTGRGLQVIESCSSRWGWHLLDEGGKVVWALLPSLLPEPPLVTRSPACSEMARPAHGRRSLRRRPR
jgi:anti-sigma regulatory factor (Ser/Thr protein kinase)